MKFLLVLIALSFNTPAYAKILFDRNYLVASSIDSKIVNHSDVFKLTGIYAQVFKLPPINRDNPEGVQLFVFPYLHNLVNNADHSNKDLGFQLYLKKVMPEGSNTQVELQCRIRGSKLIVNKFTYIPQMALIDRSFTPTEILTKTLRANFSEAAKKQISSLVSSCASLNYKHCMYEANAESKDYHFSVTIPFSTNSPKGRIVNDEIYKEITTACLST